MCHTSQDSHLLCSCFPGANFLLRSSLYDKISGWSDLGVRTVTKLFSQMNIVYFNEFSAETRPTIFVGIRCFSWGGGGRGFDLQHLYTLYRIREEGGPGRPPTVHLRNNDVT